MSKRKAKAWSLPANRQLPKKMKERAGVLTISLPAGATVVSHAMIEPAKVHVRNAINPRSVVSAQVTVTLAEGTVWNPNPMGQAVDPNVPASWGIMLMRNVDNAFYREDSRIFAMQRRPLTAGTQRLDIPLDPAQWINMWAKPMNTQKNLWRDIWKDECCLGLCFGGQFFAHGVSVAAGYATIQIDQLSFKS